jgi:hypothetical protein
MKRPAVVILGVLAACAACGPTRTRPAGPSDGPGAVPRRWFLPPVSAVSGLESGSWPERVVRDRQRTALLRVDADGSLVPGLAEGWSARKSPDGRPCWRFRLRGPHAEDVVNDWGGRLRRGDPALRILLDGVIGIHDATGPGEPPSGLSAADSRLWVCTARPDPNVPLRLAHPAAWPRLGPGVEDFSTSEIRARRSTTDAEREIARGGAVVTFARDAGEAAERGLSVRTATRWTATWGLWLNPEARWTTDPNFRAWLSRAIDRRDLAETITGGRGKPAITLVDDPEALLPDGPSRRPFSPGARPRLTLAYDPDDRLAEALASRLKAKLRESDLTIELVPVARPPYEAIDVAREPSAILFAQFPVIPDPAMTLLETLSGLGPAGERWVRRLRARPFDESERRRTLALAVQWELISETARLVPLIRVDAAIVGNAAGVRPLPGGRWLVRRP